MKKFLYETFALLSLLLCLCMLAGCGAESNPSQEEGTTESSPIAQEIRRTIPSFMDLCVILETTTG